MYYGFKHTKAVTYDECINRIFGRKIGLFANLVVFVHVFGAVVSTWIFSYTFCDGSAQQIFGSFSALGSTVFKYCYFGLTLAIMFVCVTFVNIDRLKFVAILGFLILLYLVVLFMSYTPAYFNHYNKAGEFQMEGFILGAFAFKTYGLTQYIFLNQYSIIPLCNNVKDVSFRRIKKVIFRAMCILFVVYLSVMVTGYFSQPSIALARDKLTELFILRPSFDGSRELALVVGQALFGVTLFIANLVKSQFFIMYFHQMVKNTRVLLRGGTKNELLCKMLIEQQKRERAQKRLQEIEGHIKRIKRSNSAGRCIKFNIPQKQLPLLKEIEESKENSEHEGSRPSGLEKPEQLFNITVNEPESDRRSSATKEQERGAEGSGQSQTDEVNQVQISFSKNDFEDANDDRSEKLLNPNRPILKPSDSGNVFKTDANDQPLSDKPKPKPKAAGRGRVGWPRIVVNAAVMGATFALMLTLMDSLSTFLSLIGNFVGVFEIFVFPFLIVIILNRRKKIVADWHLVGHGNYRPSFGCCSSCSRCCPWFPSSGTSSSSTMTITNARLTASHSQPPPGPTVVRVPRQEAVAVRQCQSLPAEPVRVFQQVSVLVPVLREVLVPHTRLGGPCAYSGLYRPAGTRSRSNRPCWGPGPSV